MTVSHGMWSLGILSLIMICKLDVELLLLLNSLVLRLQVLAGCVAASSARLLP